jgi:hypothetical protein
VSYSFAYSNAKCTSFGDKARWKRWKLRKDRRKKNVDRRRRELLNKNKRKKNNK